MTKPEIEETVENLRQFLALPGFLSNGNASDKVAPSILEVFDAYEARIAELEAALQVFIRGSAAVNNTVYDPYSIPKYQYEEAARVLRGEK